MDQEASAATQHADSVDALRLVVQARDAEIHMLKLLVQKLKLQVARRNHMLFGSASERFVGGEQDPQGTLLECAVLDGIAPPKPASAPVLPAANSAAADRSLPAHLPRETHTHRPETTAGHHDVAGRPCGCAECGGRLREIGRDVSEQLVRNSVHRDRPFRDRDRRFRDRDRLVRDRDR